MRRDVDDKMTTPQRSLQPADPRDDDAIHYLLRDKPAHGKD